MSLKSHGSWYVNCRFTKVNKVNRKIENTKGMICMSDMNEKNWEELRNFHSLNSRFPLKKKEGRLKTTPSISVHGNPISYDDVLDFHLNLKEIKGISRNERDFFARFVKKV
jgi:hypothetical protein